MMESKYDAVLVLSFGGPEKPEDVLPFLENVLRGRNVPRARMMEVAEVYERFGGKSPINDQNRALISALSAELEQRGPKLPVYWGNRNWHPLLPDTLRQMRDDGVKRAIVFATAAYSSYSGCRQYLEDLERARMEVGPGAPECEKLRQFNTHPGFVGPLIENVKAALTRFDEAHLLFTAHSVPLAMAQGSKYMEQLTETARLVAEGAGHPEHRLVYQSRSGPPQQPWLEPDVRVALSEIAAGGGCRNVVVAPIGFISDHMEVKFDLDTQAMEHAQSLGLQMARAATVGTHPRFIAMIRELIEERVRLGAAADPCRQDCCPYPSERKA
jgi:protoporphyrin/coproporphyrin ferrochelatase